MAGHQHEVTLVRSADQDAPRPRTERVVLDEHVLPGFQGSHPRSQCVATGVTMATASSAGSSSISSKFCVWRTAGTCARGRRAHPGADRTSSGLGGGMSWRFGPDSAPVAESGDSTRIGSSVAGEPSIPTVPTRGPSSLTRPSPSADAAPRPAYAAATTRRAPATTPGRRRRPSRGPRRSWRARGRSPATGR